MRVLAIAAIPQSFMSHGQVQCTLAGKLRMNNIKDGCGCEWIYKLYLRAAPDALVLRLPFCLFACSVVDFAPGVM